jgi:hypothetical protein
LDVTAGVTWGVGPVAEASVEVAAGFSSTWSTEETWTRDNSQEITEVLKPICNLQLKSFLLYNSYTSHFYWMNVLVWGSVLIHSRRPEQKAFIADLTQIRSLDKKSVYNLEWKQDFHQLRKLHLSIWTGFFQFSSLKYSNWWHSRDISTVLTDSLSKALAQISDLHHRTGFEQGC